MDAWFARWCLLRFLCRYDLFFLGTEILGYKTERVDPLFHHWLCDELSRPEDTLFLLPRDHTKSTWGIAVKVTQDVIRDPNASILLGSLTSSLSKMRLNVIRRHLANPWLTALFPEILAPNPESDSRMSQGFYKNIVWRSDEIIVKRSVERAEATVDTAGADQYRTGRHYERIYYDDIINEKTVQSDVQSEDALRFVKYTIPMINPQNGIIRFYGTRYDPADLYSWLMDKAMAGKDDDIRIDMRVINREVKETREQFEKYVKLTDREWKKRRVFDKKSGQWKAFIYSFYNDDLLEKKKAWLESDFIFYCQYYNTIEGIDDRAFPPPYKEVDELPEGLEYMLTVDPAFVKTRRSDYTAIVVCGYDNKNVYVAEAVRLKVEPDKLVDTLYNLNDKYHPGVMGMEQGAWQTVLQWTLEYITKKEDRGRLPIKGVPLGLEANAKANRIRSLSYFFKNDVVILKEGLEDLKHEASRYPGNTRSKDDLLDALAMQRELVDWKRDEGSGENTAKRDEEWRRKHRPTYRQIISGFKKQRSYMSY